MASQPTPTKLMFDELWQEIQESSGEIFDIPETFDADEDDLSAEEKFNRYLNSSIEHI